LERALEVVKGHVYECKEKYDSNNKDEVTIALSILGEEGVDVSDVDMDVCVD